MPLPESRAARVLQDFAAYDPAFMTFLTERYSEFTAVTQTKILATTRAVAARRVAEVPTRWSYLRKEGIVRSLLFGTSIDPLQGEERSSRRSLLAPLGLLVVGGIGTALLGATPLVIVGLIAGGVACMARRVVDFRDLGRSIHGARAERASLAERLAALDLGHEVAQFFAIHPDHMVPFLDEHLLPAVEGDAGDVQQELEGVRSNKAAVEALIQQLEVRTAAVATPDDPDDLDFQYAVVRQMRTRLEAARVRLAELQRAEAAVAQRHAVMLREVEELKELKTQTASAASDLALLQRGETLLAQGGVEAANGVETAAHLQGAAMLVADRLQAIFGTAQAIAVIPPVEPISADATEGVELSTALRITDGEE